MASNNESEFMKKCKKVCTSRSVIITAVTLAVAVGLIVAMTVAANRSKTPVRPSVLTGTSVTDALPGIMDEQTLPIYHHYETEPVIHEQDDEPQKSAFRLPVSGKLFKGHDATVQVYSTTMGDYRVHLGIDIATEADAPVCAAADGQVKEVWEDPMMGHCIAIAHDHDTVSVYKNLAQETADGIKAGASVTCGQVIGRIGDSAVLEMADEPHLHYEMTVKGLSVNPLDYFSQEEREVLARDTAYEDCIKGPCQTESVTTAITDAVTENGK